MIDGLHRKVEGHELANGLQTSHGSSDGNAGESHFCDRRVNHPFVAILLPQSTRNLIRNRNMANIKR